MNLTVKNPPFEISNIPSNKNIKGLSVKKINKISEIPKVIQVFNHVMPINKDNLDSKHILAPKSPNIKKIDIFIDRQETDKGMVIERKRYQSTNFTNKVNPNFPEVSKKSNNNFKNKFRKELTFSPIKANSKDKSTMDFCDFSEIQQKTTSSIQNQYQDKISSSNKDLEIKNAVKYPNNITFKIQNVLKSNEKFFLRIKKKQNELNKEKLSFTRKSIFPNENSMNKRMSNVVEIFNKNSKENQKSEIPLEENKENQDKYGIIEEIKSEEIKDQTVEDLLNENQFKVEEDDKISIDSYDPDYQDADIVEIDEGGSLLSNKMTETHQLKMKNLVTTLNIYSEIYPVKYQFAKGLKKSKTCEMKLDEFTKLEENKIEFDENRKNTDKDILQENSWKNYMRMIDKYLLCLAQIRKCKLQELEKLRYYGELDLNKQFRDSVEIQGAINYVSRILKEDVNSIKKAKEKITKLLNFTNDIIDKIECRVFECLKIINKEMKYEPDTELVSNFNDKILKAYKIFRDKSIISQEFKEKVESALSQKKANPEPMSKNIKEFFSNNNMTQDFSKSSLNCRDLNYSNKIFNERFNSNYNSVISIDGNLSKEKHAIKQKLLNKLHDNFVNENITTKVRFDVPSQYSFCEDSKILYELPKFDGSFVRFCENSSFEIIFPNNVIHKIYEDGCIVTIFSNKDIRIIFPNADIFYKFRIVGIVELDFYDKNYCLIQYKNGTIEKIMKNGMRIIKSSHRDNVLIIDLEDYQYTKNEKDGEFIGRKLRVKNN